VSDAAPPASDAESGPPASGAQASVASPASGAPPSCGPTGGVSQSARHCARHATTSQRSFRGQTTPAHGSAAQTPARQRRPGPQSSHPPGTQRSSSQSSSARQPPQGAATHAPSTQTCARGQLTSAHDRTQPPSRQKLRGPHATPAHGSGTHPEARQTRPDGQPVHSQRSGTQRPPAQASPSGQVTPSQRATQTPVPSSQRSSGRHSTPAQRLTHAPSTHRAQPSPHGGAHSPRTHRPSGHRSPSSTPFGGRSPPQDCGFASHRSRRRAGRSPRRRGSCAAHIAGARTGTRSCPRHTRPGGRWRIAVDRGGQQAVDEVAVVVRQTRVSTPRADAGLAHALLHERERGHPVETGSGIAREDAGRRLELAQPRQPHLDGVVHEAGERCRTAQALRARRGGKRGQHGMPERMSCGRPPGRGVSTAMAA
jgi:hypothetical protein